MAGTGNPPPEPALRMGAGFAAEFPGASRAATECAINLVRGATLFLAEADRYRRTVTDLSAAACQVLAVIEGAGEPLPPYVIASRLLVTSGTITSVLDTLQRRGYIVRVPHPGDRRKLLIDITESARTLLDALLPRIHAVERAMFGVLSEQESAALVDLLGRVQAQALNLASAPPAVEAARRVTPNRA